jgi:hypothetical protein
MGWVLTASGDCPEGDERDLAAKLEKLLATGKYGTAASQMSGLAHNGPVHQPAKGSAN